MSVVHIPFRKGMDEGVDPRQAEPGTLTLLKNGVFTRGGEVRKRYGMTSLGALDERGNELKVRRVFTRGDSLCAIGTSGTGKVERVYSYLESRGVWVPGQSSPEFMARWFTPTDSYGNIANPDVAYANGQLLYVWRDGDTTPFTAGTLYLSVVEAVSGTVVLPPTVIATAALYPRIVKAGSRCIIAWQDNATARLFAVYLDPADPVASVSVSSDISGAALVGQHPFDLAPGANDRVIWAYTLGGDVQLLHTSNTFAVAGGPFNLGAPGVTTNIGLSSFGDYAHVVYADAAGPTNRCAIFSMGGVLVGDAALAASLVGLGNGSINQPPPVCLGLSATQTLAICGRVASVRDASTGLQVGQTVTVDGPVVGRPFLASSGRYYCVVAVMRAEAAEAVPVASPMLVELPLPNSSGATLPSIPSGSFAPRMWGDTSHASHVVFDGTGYWAVGSTSLDPLSITIILQHQTPVFCRFTPERGRTVTILGGLCVSANAVPWTFDGAVVGDVGYTTHAPTLAQGGAGALTALGTYIVALVYERYDALGILHRSAPTYATLTLVGANQAISVSKWYLTTSSKQRSTVYPARIAVYMTDNAGSLFYRQTLGALAVANDPVVGGYVTAALAGFASGGQYSLLYTTGGVLPDNPPPGFTDICVHRDRVWGAAGDGRTLWFSKRMSDQPRIFPGFHETQTLQVEGRVVGLASHEGMLLILCKNGLYILDGEGPPATGYPTDYGPPRKVPSDVGCLTPDSVVTSASGTFFQGSDGRIYRIQGALVGHVGKAIEDDILAYPVVTAAVLVEKRSQVRFTCMNAALTAGIVLVYDMAFNQWSRFEYHAKAVHGCYWRGKYVAVLDTEAYVEDEATFYDAVTNWVYLELVTAWISFTSPTGWQRVRRVEVLGEYRGPHKFYLELSCDYSASWLQSCLFDEAATLVNQGRVTAHVGSQSGMSPRNRAIRLRLRDDPRAYVAGQTGEAVRWSGIGLDVLQQEGVARHGAAKAKV